MTNLNELPYVCDFGVHVGFIYVLVGESPTK